MSIITEYGVSHLHFLVFFRLLLLDERPQERCSCLYAISSVSNNYTRVWYVVYKLYITCRRRVSVNPKHCRKGVAGYGMTVYFICRTSTRIPGSGHTPGWM